MKSLKIVIADNESVIRMDVREMLEEAGHEVVGEAVNGKKAVELARRYKPDLCILDVKMPGMDGIETLEEIKRKYPLVEVIMLTGHATVPSAIDGMKKGAFDYLMKPCDMEVLVTKVGEAVAKKRAQESKIVEARMKDIMRRKGFD